MREIKFRAWNGDEMSIPFSLHDDLREVSPNYDVIMQYTGLKDKNGVEIYEGDILIYIDKRRLTHNFIEEVVWVDNEYNCGWSTDSSQDVWAEVAPQSKVIGNIYENPELIQE